MQGSINQNDVKHAIRFVIRDVGNNAFNREAFFFRRAFKIAYAAGCLVDADNAMSKPRNKQRIATLATANVQNSQSVGG